jgi:hypothetical protein
MRNLVLRLATNFTLNGRILFLGSRFHSKINERYVDSLLAKIDQAEKISSDGNCIVDVVIVNPANSDIEVLIGDEIVLEQGLNIVGRGTVFEKYHVD